MVKAGLTTGPVALAIAGVADGAEQAAIARAKRVRGRGMSLRYIVAKLALDGHSLNPESVRRLLARQAEAEL